MSDIEFRPWPKIPRLFRDVIITEKIDGTNAAVGVLDDGRVYAQSRKRIITPGDDNFGFAAWVADNAGTLVDDLGPGLHFGEWWGRGIQRGYGLDGRRFSLFNTTRYGNGAALHTPGLGVVPVLYAGPFDTDIVADVLNELRTYGSSAAKGYDNPEGVVVYHVAAGQCFKALCENDDVAKGDTVALRAAA